MYRNYLFNFSASCSGGGLKRLTEYLKWYNKKGGATFIIRKECKHLVNAYPNIDFNVVDKSLFDRIVNDWKYIDEIVIDKKPLFYYSYGIPIYKRVGIINWFHLSNVLPLKPNEKTLSIIKKIKYHLIGYRIKKNLINADYISAESNHSLTLFEGVNKRSLVVSVNGSDDELFGTHEKKKNRNVDNIAVVVGTYNHKALSESFKIFLHLLRENNDLMLIIIGKTKSIPNHIASHRKVRLTGSIQREKVISTLNSAKYYISTTRIENSYNAASEGIYHAEQSFISCIGPHLELLHNEPYRLVQLKGLESEVIHVRREELSKKT